jgi:hypothetical protein
VRCGFLLSYAPTPRLSYTSIGESNKPPVERPLPSSLTAGSKRPSRRTSRTAYADLPPQLDDPLLGFAPYIHPAPRRNSITPDRKRAFIAVLAASGIFTQVARSMAGSARRRSGSTFQTFRRSAVLHLTPRSQASQSRQSANQARTHRSAASRYRAGSAASRPPCDSPAHRAGAWAARSRRSPLPIAG